MATAQPQPNPNANEDTPEILRLSFLERTKVFFEFYWRSIVIVLWPIILLPILLNYDNPAVRCAYVILIMAVYWVTECIPIAVTALIPIVLFPCFGILDSRQVTACYMNDTILVFLGGLILAIAIEHSKLHLRLALAVMRIVGCSHARLLGGLCTVTTFISMWISNTAATAMMIPIIFAVLKELEKEGLSKMFDEGEPDPEDPEKNPILKPTSVTKGYLLATAYCATFGGTGTLVGTGTNLTFKGIYEEIFPEAPGITFTEWITWAFIPMALNSFLTWFYIRMFYLGMLRPKSADARAATIGTVGQDIANQVMREKYQNLGPMSFHEWGVGILFSLCVFLWIFRSPGFIIGWSEVVTSIEVKDSAPVLFVSILMFIIPKNPSFIYSYSQNVSKRPVSSSEGLINWKVINSQMPWNLMFLLGGGFAISKGSDHSCLSKKIGLSLVALKDLPPVIILFVVCLFVGTITEFTSNIGVANIILPVVAQMCIAIEQHPLYLMLPATFTCSYSFRLPVGTPPNAIASGIGNIKIKSLIAGGCIPAIYSLVTLIILFPTWGVYVYEIREFPEWARSVNSSKNDNC